MKQAFAFLVIGFAGIAASLAMSVGEPARADIAVVQAATQPLIDGIDFPGLED